MAVFFLLMASQANARSVELITERASLEDRSGSMTWREVQQSGDWQIKTNSPVMSLGYGSSPVWFRLRIDPTLADLPADAKLLMRIRPSYLDELILFDPLQTPAQQPAIGDSQPQHDSAEPSSSLSYSLPAGTQSRYVWLRLSATSTRLAHFEVMDELSMRQSNRRIEHFGALYLSVLFVFIVWGMLQLTVRTDRLTVTFVFYQISALLFGACLFGYASLYAEKWLPPIAIDKATSILAVLSTFFVFIFSSQLLDTLKKNRWKSVYNLTVQLAFLACIVLIATEQVRTALQLNMSIIFLLPMIHLLIAVLSPQNRQVRGQQKIPKFATVTYFSVTLVITLLASLPALNLAPATELSHYVVSFYSVCSGLLMMMVIQYRSVQNIKERSLLSAQAQQANQQAEQERHFRQETEQLLNMLGHELKTPLSTMLLQVNDPLIPTALSRNLGAAVSDLAHVIERTVQVGQLDHKKIELHQVDCDFPDFLKNLIANMPEANRIQTEIGHLHTNTLKTDVYLLNIVIRNLLDNALKYSPGSSLISAQLRQSIQPPEWQLTVSNRPGRAGWPDVSKVFERYYRSPAAHYRSGTGLGLFLIHSLTERLGGRVEYQPNEHSIVFHLTVPAR